MNPQLQDYIKKSREAGFSDEQIREELLKVGWKGEDINEGLSYIVQPAEATQSSEISKSQKPKKKSGKKILIIGVGILIIVLLFIDKQFLISICRQSIPFASNSGQIYRIILLSIAPLMVVLLALILIKKKQFKPLRWKFIISSILFLICYISFIVFLSNPSIYRTSFHVSIPNYVHSILSFRNFPFMWLTEFLGFLVYPLFIFFVFFFRIIILGFLQILKKPKMLTLLSIIIIFIYLAVAWVSWYLFILFSFL
jgi:hypothetical protein